LGVAVVVAAGWYITTHSSPTPQASNTRGGRFGQGQATPVGIAAAAKATFRS
jgi:hypothetical protein